MAIPVTNVSMLAEAAYKSRYSKGDQALIAELGERCGGKLHKNTLRAEHGARGFHLTFLPKQQGCVVSVPCRLAGRVRVTRKSKLDRWMEAFVPALEFRSRDARFDHDFNVLTRDREVATAVLTRRPLRDAVRRLFQRGVRDVHIDAERVKVTCPRKTLGKEPRVEDVLALVEQLAPIAEAIDRFATSHEVHPAPAVDPQLVSSWIALGVLGLAGFGMLIAGAVEFTLVRPASFLLPCALFGLPPILPVIFVLALVVQRRTSPYALVRGLAALSMVVVPLFVSGGMLLANGLFDGGPASEHVVSVAGKSARKDKNEMRYHAGLEAWWPEGDLRWLRISEDTFERIEPRVSRMRVTTRPGVLGYEWLADYRLEP